MKDLWDNEVAVQQVPKRSIGNLSRSFIVPPFSVLNMLSGEWQQRKRAWISLGIRSEVGRNAAASGSRLPTYKVGEDGKFQRGDLHATSVDESCTSIFDPVLCELMYSWFVPVNGTVLDPFAGGSVRGIVAAHCGLHYTGIDLSEEQVSANIEQALYTVPAHALEIVEWIVGDSMQLLKYAGGKGFDFIFTCPPYYNLEQYSSDPRDLSNCPTYAEFIEKYTTVIAKCCRQLNDNRFACFVVGNLRAEDGHVYDLVGDTITAFSRCGVQLYNDIVLITPTGSAQVRAGKIFAGGRKVTRTHQTVLVFIKGEWRKAMMDMNSKVNNHKLVGTASDT